MSEDCWQETDGNYSLELLARDSNRSLDSLQETAIVV